MPSLSSEGFSLPPPILIWCHGFYLRIDSGLPSFIKVKRYWVHANVTIKYSHPKDSFGSHQTFQGKCQGRTQLPPALLLSPTFKDQSHPPQCGGRKEGQGSASLSLACLAWQAETRLTLIRKLIHSAQAESERFKVRAARQKVGPKASGTRPPPGVQALGAVGGRAGPGKAPGPRDKGKISAPSP